MNVFWLLSKTLCQGTARRGPAQYTAMFAFTDLEHNRRSLKQAVMNHKITPKQYEVGVVLLMLCFILFNILISQSSFISSIEYGIFGEGSLILIRARIVLSPL